MDKMRKEYELTWADSCIFTPEGTTPLDHVWTNMEGQYTPGNQYMKFKLNGKVLYGVVNDKRKLLIAYKDVKDTAENEIRLRKNVRDLTNKFGVDIK